MKIIEFLRNVSLDLLERYGRKKVGVTAGAVCAVAILSIVAIVVLLQKGKTDDVAAVEMDNQSTLRTTAVQTVTSDSSTTEETTLETEEEDETIEVIDDVAAVIADQGEGYVYEMIMSSAKEEITGNSNFDQASVKESSAMLSVSSIMQLPELPTGCEVTSLTILLNYLGFGVSKGTMADNYLPKCELGQGTYWNYFIGNPRSEYSYGCFAGPIVTAANSYLSEKGSEYRANNVSNSDFSTLLNYVNSGNPVLVWNTMYLSQPFMTDAWTINGEVVQWYSGEHCVVLIGYDLDGNTVTIADPLQGIVSCNMDTFVERYRQIASQAVVITKKETETTAVIEAPSSQTEAPTQKPTEAPTQKPTEAPTQKPTEEPTTAPEVESTVVPEEEPVETPGDGKTSE